jgi:hypothetical protein
MREFYSMADAAAGSPDHEASLGSMLDGGARRVHALGGGRRHQEER